MSDADRPLKFRRRQRLQGGRAFDAVYDARARKHAGPLAVLSRPNDLDYARLGLSVGRRVGPATQRNRIKRRIREAFRLDQHDLPAGYDYVIVVRPHDPAPLADYRQWLADAAEQLDSLWQKRDAREAT